MCAAGTLYVNGYGYPALILKMTNFLLAGLWLVLNYVDNQAYDYPLIIKKYSFLLLIAPLIITESALQDLYFLGLKPNIITSCCGSLFSNDAAGLSASIAALPIRPAMVSLFMSFGLTFASGIFYLLTRKGGYVFALLSGLMFLVSVAGIISFLSVYIYELPTHHCPFCLLQKEYGYIGYPLYISLFSAAIMGIGVGLLMPFRHVKSMSEILPNLQRKLAINALILFSVFITIVIYKLLSSNLLPDVH